MVAHQIAGTALNQKPLTLKHSKKCFFGVVLGLRSFAAQPPTGTEPVLSRATLPQPFPLDINPQPSPVVSLIAEALGLSCKVLGLVGWNATLVDVDGHPFLEGFDVRDQDRISYCGWAHDVPSQSGRRIPSTISRFCASLMPPE